MDIVHFLDLNRYFFTETVIASFLRTVSTLAHAVTNIVLVYSRIS